MPSAHPTSGALPAIALAIWFGAVAGPGDIEHGWPNRPSPGVAEAEPTWATPDRGTGEASPAGTVRDGAVTPDRGSQAAGPANPEGGDAASPDALRILDAQLRLRRNPLDPAPHFDLGEAYYHTGNRAAARHHLETFLRTAAPGPDSLRAAHLHARILLALGLRLRATRALARLVERPGCPTGALHDYALLLRKDRFPVEAVMSEMRAVEEDPGNAAYLREAAREWKELARPDQSLVQWQQLVASGHAGCEDYFQLGHQAHWLQAFDLAERAYEAALQKDPGHAAAHYNLSLLSERSGRIDEAVHHLEEVLRLRPRYEPAYFHLGQLLLSEKRPVEAESVFRRYLLYGADSLALAEARDLIRSLEDQDASGGAPAVSP